MKVQVKDKQTPAGTSRIAGEKSETTRRRILTAALTVFANHPFNAASMRMIGKAGGFDHAIIRYYFPNKAKLFETVMKEACDIFHQANTAFFDGLDSMPLQKGFSLYLDRLLDYYEHHPETFKLIMQNMAQANTPDLIPGYQQIPKLVQKLRHTFVTRALVASAAAEDIARFQDSFNTLVLCFLGADACQRHILAIDKKTTSYRSWIKETLFFLFLPTLEKLTNTHRSAAGNT